MYTPTDGYVDRNDYQKQEGATFTGKHVHFDIN